MKIEDLHHTVIRLTLPPDYKMSQPWPKNAMTIDGLKCGLHVRVSVERLFEDTPKIFVNEQRVIYPTSLYVNDVLQALDRGLLWEHRPLVLKGVKA